MNKPVLPVSSLSLKLPNAGRGVETYRLAGSSDVSVETAGHTQSRRLFRGPCRGRSARRRDPWLDAAIDWDGRSPFAAICGPRPRRRRSDGHRPARHGAGLADIAGADPPFARRRQGVPGALIVSGAGTDHSRPDADVTSTT